MNYLKVAFYPVITVLCFFIIKRDWKLYNNRIVCNGRINGKRLRICSCFIISTIIGIYSLSFNHTFWWLDVAYYNRFFSTGKEFPDSIGLNAIFWVLHLFTNNIDVLLFCVAFLATLVMLLAYNSFQESYPICIELLFFTTFFIAICQVSLKQAIACGLATLSIYAMIHKNTFKALVYLLLASCFHVTAGPILLLTFVAIKVGSSKRYLKYGIYILTLLGVIFFQHVFHVLIKVAHHYPFLLSKMEEYSTASGYLARNSTGWVAFKGLPFYLITVLGVLKRRKGHVVIEEYDAFLAVSFIASISYYLSYYSYWMTRIIAYYWMIDLLFLGIICYKDGLKNENSRYYICVIGGIMALLSFRELALIYL